jgi:putative flippase GtrA
MVGNRKEYLLKLLEDNKNMDKIAVLIPCYNEAKTIAKVVSDFKREIPEAVIYVYDNNSSDKTAEIAKNNGAIVRHEYQQGKGNVIRRMFAEIDAECYIMVDGDDTYPAENVRDMVDCVLEKKVDMVVGDRLSSTYFEENKRPFHNFGNSIVRKSINVLFKNDIKDIMTGYRAFSYRFVKTFPVLSKGFEIETEMSIHAIDKNMHIANVVIDYRDRPAGSESKLNTYSDGFKVLKTICRLFRTYRPMAFFGIIAFVLMLISAGFFIPVLVSYFKTGLVEKFPTLIVCGFVALSAIQSFFTGVMLNTIYAKNRQDFEIDLYNVMRDEKNYMKTKDKDIFDKIMELPGLRVFNPIYVKYKEMLLYLFFGGLSFVVSIATYALFNVSFGINELIANILSWIITVMFAFLTNRIWVFNSPTNGLEEFIKQMVAFYGGRVVTLVVEEVILLVFITLLHFQSMLVKVVAQVIVIVLNYVISKLVIFNKESK